MPLALVQVPSMSHGLEFKPFLMWDPLVQIREASTLYCPVCDEMDNRKACLRRGSQWTTRARHRSRSPRLLTHTDCSVWLVSKIYICDQHHEVLSSHPRIIGKLPNVPFTLTHKKGATMELRHLIVTLTNSGLSFANICKTIRENFKHRQDYLNILKVSAADDLPPTSSKFYQNVYVMELMKNYRKYMSTMQTVTGTWLSCDHTFKCTGNVGYRRRSDNKWTQIYNSVFCIMNEHGQVLKWLFTKGESFDEIRQLFEELDRRINTNGVPIQGTC